MLGDVDPAILRYIPTDWQETLLSAPIDLTSETLGLSLEITETLNLLTGRQQQVAYALAQGFTQREIADALKLSQRTVASEVARIRAVFRREHGAFGLGGDGQSFISKKGLHT